MEINWNLYVLLLVLHFGTVSDLPFLAHGLAAQRFPAPDPRLPSADTQKSDMNNSRRRVIRWEF